MRTILAAALLLVACRGNTPALEQVDRLTRSRQLTAWLYAGQFDSLPSGTILDLAGDGDSMLVRWFVHQKIDSLGREWPSAVILTLVGRDGGATFLEQLHATYGREQTMVEDGIYPYHLVKHSVEYDRIARFSKFTDNTVTVAWLWRGDTLVGGWVVPSLQAAPTAYEGYETKTLLRLPFDGEWAVTSGGRKPHENYHVQIPSLRFAFDFLVDSGGSAFRTDGKTNADHYCFGRPILAPAAGRVVSVVDTFTENVPGRRPPGYRGPGNNVVIDHGNGEFSVLAHFRRGSITVTAGQQVQAGDTIGACGNNGLSDLPHLHYQLQLDPRPGQEVIPAFFTDYRVGAEHVARGEPRGGQRVQHAGRP